MTQIPVQMRQYEDPLLNDVPGRPPDTDTTSVEPTEHDGNPGCMRQLRQDDAIKGFLAGCARRAGECRNAGARPEGPKVETRCLGNVPELLESDSRGLEGGLGSMPKGATYWMRENPLSVDAQCCARLKAESCTKAGSADTCARLTDVGVRDTGVVRGYAEGCAKHITAVTRAERTRPLRCKAEGERTRPLRCKAEGCDAESMPAGTRAYNVDVVSRDVVVRGESRGLSAKVQGHAEVRRRPRLPAPLS
jgi:hypothetical protein